ncbi:hypothetical protein QEN19_004419 [Hanseniaspora menglaensis]
MTYLKIIENQKVKNAITNFKNDDSLKNIKFVMKLTPFVMQQKLGVSYVNRIKDENVDFLIKKFQNLSKNITLLEESLANHIKQKHIFASSLKTVVERFKIILEKQEWEKLYESKLSDKNCSSFENSIKQEVKISNSLNMSFGIRSEIAKHNKDLSECQTFSPQIYLEKSLDKIEETIEPVCSFFYQKIIGNLEELTKKVLIHIQHAIQKRLISVTKYNRYKSKFEEFEDKELKVSLSLLEKKNYKHLMKKLHFTAMEYEKINCIIKNGLTEFFNVFFPTFLEIWFQQFYFTLYSLDHLIYLKLGLPKETKKAY